MPFQYNPVLDGLGSPNNNQEGSVDTGVGWNIITSNKATNALLLNGGGIITRGSGAVAINIQYNSSIQNRRYQIVGAGQGLWTLKLTVGQIVQFGNSSIITSVAATEPSDCLDLIYVGANTWAQSSSVGNLELT